ncbi:MAG: GtrA family protein [Wenzhouxiangella sp.]|nr:GtrA family protein [Wenzhouxiangella sp.]
MSLHRQGLLFLIVGGLQLLLDWAVFVLLSWLGLTVVAANLLARLSAAACGFYLNGRVTFADRNGARLGRMRLVRFLVLWALLTLMSTVLVQAVSAGWGLSAAWLFKPALEAGLAILSFLIQRHWVYGAIK